MRANGFRNTILAGAVLACLTPVGLANAAINDDLNAFYDAMGGNASVSGPALYQGQSAGYMTLGGLDTRVPVRNFQPLSIQPPSIRAGCGGIDVFMGGFSFINADQFVQMMQAIGSNAVGYAFQLALDTISPQISGILDKLRATSDFINSVNINSCNAAKELVKGAAIVSGARKSYCDSALAFKGTASDYTQSRYMCQDQTLADNLLKSSWQAPAGSTDKQQAEELVGNLVWQGLQNQGVAANRDFANAIISMTGTVVRYPPGHAKQDQVVYYPPKLFFEDIYNPTPGTTAEAYECSTADCLEIVAKPVDVSGWRKRIDDLVNSIADKIINGGALTTQETQLIGMMRTPIYGLLQSAADANPLLAQSLADKFKPYIAAEVAHAYVARAAQTARAAILTGKMSDPAAEDAKRNFLEGLNQTMLEASNRLAIEENRMGSVADTMRLYNDLRSLAMNKYAPAMQQRLAFAKLLDARR